MEDHIYSSHFSVGPEGHLYIDGVDTVDIAAKYGTAAYVMSESAIRESCRQYMSAMRESFGQGFKVSYASKALCAGFMYKIILEEGLHADVVSGGEMYTAFKAGFPPERIHFHGNNKTPEEIKLAVELKIGSVVIDSFEEIGRLDAAMEGRSYKMPVLLRIKPGIEAHTHEAVQTGKIDSKFGFGIEAGEAYRAAEAVKNSKNLLFYGVHCHIGSQIFETEPFDMACRVMFDLICDMEKKLGLKSRELILGGGFGIKYTENDHPMPAEDMIKVIASAAKKYAGMHDMALPEITIEPGRSIVGPAGITLYTVGSVKDIPGARCYVAVDGGMPDNPRFAYYGSEYQAVVANKADRPKDKLQTIAGKCCESGDLVAQDIYMQPAEAGDIICVFATGAYNYSMASNYNRVPRLPIILVNGGQTRVVVRRETYEDLIRNDIF